MNRETDSGVPRRDARWLVWRRLATLGGACAVAVAVGGGGIELWRLGASTEAAFSRLQRVVRASITDAARDLTDVAHGLAGRADLADRIGGDREQVQALFAALQTITGSADLELAVTIYGPGGLPEAWSGRPSEIAPDRVTGGTSLFATPGPLGLRLVAVEPVLRRRGSAEGEGRVGTVVVERLLSPDQPTPGTPEPAFRFASSSAPVLLRVWSGPRDAAADASRFVVKGPDGARLLEADVLPAALAGARRAWRSRVLSLVVLILAVTVLLLAGPLLDWRARARSTEDYMSAVVSLVGVILTGQVLLRWALPSRWRATSPSTLLAPAVSRDVGFTTVDLLLGAFVVVALVGVSAHLVDRWRRASRRRRRAAASDAATQRRFTVEHAVAGTVVALGFAGYATALRSIIDRTDVDVLHLSLHPWDADRLTLIAGLHLLHAGAVWAAVVVFSASLARWRLDRHRRDLAVRVMAAWGLPILLVVGLARMLSVPLPASPLLLVTGAAMGAALMAPRGVARFRHASQGSRLVGLFLALLAPALLMYPMTVEFADRAERRVIATQYARQATNHADSVERSLTSSLVQIDEIADLPAMLTPIPAPRGAAGYSDNALLIWRQTDLAARRLTSAVELYTPGGARVSRFAVNVPEYAPAPPRPSVGCAWEVFSEASPFSGHEGQIVHAQRTVCRTGRDGAVDRVGTVVVHVMLDYRVLPFVAPDSPYVELFRRERVPPEGTSGRDVELVIYGWGLRYPIFASAGDAWPIADETFDRVRMSREPFWTTLTKGGVPYNVYITNDRAGIYALGIPARGPFDRLLHGAEIATLAGLTFIVLLLGATLLSRLARRRPRVGRLLLLEIKASFYRKLFLAFVAAAVVPVLVLALMIRAYFATQLRADVEAEAIRTAAVAQRVIQEMATLSQASDDELTPLSDGVMVWISQAIDQDVNIFDGPRLVATSERDLFASGLLPVRTPGDVFHAIALQRLPSFVGADTIGDLRYMLAATPVRAGDRDAILTVPLASRQQEIEREIDSLDRGIHLGAVLFIMLGAGIGLSMAERIADPVKRLTPRDAADRTGRFRRPGRGSVGRRAPAARRSVQCHGGRIEGAARPAGADEPARGLGRDGPPGCPRDQEPTHPDPALGGASAPGAYRSRSAAGAGARELRRVDPDPGPAAATDLGGVLELRVLTICETDAHRARRIGARGHRVVPSGAGRSHSRDGRRAVRLADPPARPRAGPARGHQHRRERPACDARSRDVVDQRHPDRPAGAAHDHRHGCGDGQGHRGPYLRAVLFDASDR